MTDGMVILGTIGLVGLVAVSTVALVYNRPLLVRGNSSSVEVQTNTATDKNGAGDPPKGLDP